jgi:predicted dehydrogenase
MKVGIMGLGGIAHKMAETLRAMDGVEAYAAASRDGEKAKTFSGQYGIKKAYASYEDMAKDPGVDLIYIATPHSHHFEHMKLCLEYDKPVLCEKAFTINAGQAKTILDLAKQKQLLVAEGIWSRYLPARSMINDILASNVIGDLHSLMASICGPPFFMERLVRPELGGGALLDIGVYLINFALMTFGDNITGMNSAMTAYETGVDGKDSITLTYGDGKMAVLHGDIFAYHDYRRAVILGEKGYIELQNFSNCSSITVYIENKEVKSYTPPKQITGFEYEVASCKEALGAGRIECPEMPHSEIIRVMEIMDALRQSWGLSYPGELI